MGEIPDRADFNLAGQSRYDKAAVADEAKYQKFKTKQANEMGIEE